jgi:two-component system, cell cycle sensor histidine kinase and response regulator CckA
MRALALKAEQAAAALRESEERFRSVVESATDAIILADNGGNILSWNNGAQRLFQYCAQEMLGQPLTRLMPQRYRRSHEIGLARAGAGGRPCLTGKTIELHGLRKDGTEFPLELSLATWQTNESTFYSGIIRDTTERKHAEEALRRAHSETEQILASLPSTIIIANQSCEIIYANYLAHSHFGAEETAGSLLGRSIFDVLPIAPVEWDRLARDIQCRPPSDSTQHHGEFESRKRLYQYRLFSVALYGNGETQTGVVISDVTEHKHLQDQLIQAEKLASLGTLVSGMAHEINNPVHGILAMAEIIMDETQPEKIHEYARDIVDYSKHVATVVKDFACYARPASCDPQEEVDINERLLEATKMVRHNPQFGDVDVVTRFEAVPRLWLRRSELDQVLVNLISNAVQAMEGDGVLTLSSSLINSQVEASVGDTGIGIPKSVIPRIFDPFFTTKDSGKGTGLGLSIVHKIVTKNGGTIAVESEEGRGSRFIIRFPLSTLVRREVERGPA